MAFKCSSIIKVILGAAGADISFSPNPVKGNLVKLKFSNQPAGIYNIRPITTTGQVVKSLIINNPGGSSFKTFPVSSLKLSRAFYLLEKIDSRQNKTDAKIII